MMEEEAARWIADADVPRETLDRLTRIVACVCAENDRQNLIAPSTLDTIWSRHIVDSLQLLRFAPAMGAWLDIGSGAGFPGLAIAAAREAAMTLVEPRRLRAEFLIRAAETIGIADRITVVAGRIETMIPAGAYAVISARAVASLDRLFTMAHRLADPDTIWLLPKGRSAREELEEARRSWQGDMRLEPSITDPDAAIVVARGIVPRKRR